MYPCLNTSTIRPVPLAHKIPMITRAGFQFAELWNDEINDHLHTTGESLLDLRKRLDDHGLKVAGVIALMGWADASNDSFPDILHECQTRINQAAQLGSPAIVASPPLGHVPATQFIERLTQLRQLAQSQGLVVQLEFLGFTQQYNSLKSVLEIVHSPQCLGLPIVADIYHLMRGGGTMQDILKLKAPELGIFHINDLPSDPNFSVQTDHDRVMLGHGVINLPKAISYLRQIHYQGPVSLELFNKTLWAADPEHVLSEGYARLKALLDERDIHEKTNNHISTL